jgi:hypothetical protein
MSTMEHRPTRFLPEGYTLGTTHWWPQSCELETITVKYDTVVSSVTPCRVVLAPSNVELSPLECLATLKDGDLHFEAIRYGITLVWAEVTGCLWVHDAVVFKAGAALHGVGTVVEEFQVQVTNMLLPPGVSRFSLAHVHFTNGAVLCATARVHSPGAIELCAAGTVHSFKMCDQLLERAIDATLRHSILSIYPTRHFPLTQSLMSRDNAE